MTTHTSDTPLPVNLSPTDLHTGSSKESPPILNSPETYTSSVVPTPSILLILQESPTHNLHITSWPLSPIVSTRQFCLASPGNRTRASAVGVRGHNHQATNYSWDSDFTVYLFPLPQSRTDLGHISLSSPCTRHFFICSPPPVLIMPQHLTVSIH